MLAGAPAEGAALVERAEREWGAAPDDSSYEYAVQLHCQALRVQRAVALVEGLRRAAARAAGAGAPPPPGVGAAAAPLVYVAIARAAALLGPPPPPFPVLTGQVSSLPSY